ncbi:hypothetical protein [Pyruvatibacter mobilis]|uniref:hypothetical protein n=1 Tax=Pyruvatibacter mobilis TaxID=1712261 RepID=UPI003C7E8362
MARADRAHGRNHQNESYDRGIEVGASRIARTPGSTLNDRNEFSERVSRTGRELNEYILDKRVKLK